MESNGSPKGLPDNAYKELSPGEVYEPIVAAGDKVPEITMRSVVLGVLMSALFSAAAAYLGLKIGQVFEAAIPIAILAVGMASVFPRKSTILENVIIQSIGAASGVIVAGAIFTLPALYILGLDKMVGFFKVFFVALFGGALGILFLIPLRRYFCAQQHGKLPFPEATATTEVLVAGEKGGSQAKVLATAMAVGGVYDFLVSAVHLWKETFSTRFLPFMHAVTHKARLLFSFNIGAAVMGLGYIIGVRYAAIICAGSFLAWFVFVPLMAWLGNFVTLPVPPETHALPLASMDAEQIFGTYVRLIGIGGIFMAGVLGIIKSSKIIVSSFTVGIREIFRGTAEAAHTTEQKRTDRDLPMGLVMGINLLLILAIWVFFRFFVVSGQHNPMLLSLIALAVVVIISFLFTPVAARAIAIVGTNPVSGMTLMTLIVSSLILIASGLKGRDGMLAALLIGGVVCTALSMAGGFITDLKIGYWIGATPKRQEMWKFLGTIVAAASVSGVIILLNKTYGFAPDRPERLVAPQANAMAAVISTFMSESPVPWALYGVGAAIALIMEMVGVPSLAFALGMYIPLELNAPILAGALVAWVVKRGAKSEKAASRRHDRGVLIASGFIAGGALMGVVGALFKFLGWDLNVGIDRHDWSNYVSVIMFAFLAIYVIYEARRADKLTEGEEQ